MQINSVSYVNYTKYNNGKKRTNIIRRNNDNLAFQGLGKIKLVNRLSFNPLNKLKDFSKEEYEKISPYEIKFLRFMYKNFVKVFDNDFYKNAENIHKEASEIIKNSLDKEFGEGKYVFIPIGRSISSIGKILSYKIGAENVISIPMSSAHRFLHSNLEKCLEYNGDYKILNGNILKSDNVDVFKKILDKIGLSEKNINNSNKHYVICDFCFSGTSLAGVKKLFESDFLFGKRDNIHYRNVMNLVPENFDFNTKLRHYLYESAFKRFSFVNSSKYLNSTMSSFKDIKKEPMSTRLFWFKLLDDAMKK